MLNPLQPDLRPEGGVAALPFLRIYLSGTFLRNMKLEAGSYVGGRDPHVEIVLEGRFVSRRHFQVVYGGENKLAIQDLGSSNGTFVNGSRITRAPLAHGDEIQLGEVKIVVSHRAFAASNIIPFPVTRTDPMIAIPIPEPAAPVPAPIPKVEPRVKIKKKSFPLGNLIFVIAAAGGVAYGVKYYMERPVLVAIMTQPPKSIATIAPSAEPVEEVPLTPAPAIVEKVAPPKSKAVKEAPVPKNRLAESLNSLEDLSSQGDLGKLSDRLNNERAKGDNNLLALKTLKKPSNQAMDVEIKMPRMEEMTEAMKASRAAEMAKKLWGPEDFDHYQKMLRSRLTGVDGCYARHGDGSGGKVSISLTLAKSGMVRSSKVELTTFKNKALEDCMLKQVNSAQVDPPPWDGFTVSYGFRFGARQVEFR